MTFGLCNFCKIISPTNCIDNIGVQHSCAICVSDFVICNICLISLAKKGMFLCTSCYIKDNEHKFEIKQCWQCYWVGPCLQNCIECKKNASMCAWCAKLKTNPICESCDSKCFLA